MLPGPFVVSPRLEKRESLFAFFFLFASFCPNRRVFNLVKEKRPESLSNTESDELKVYSSPVLHHHEGREAEIF